MYTVNIVCDNCGSEAVVPQVGSAPGDWVQLRHVNTQQPDKPIAKAFCGWKCLMSYVGKVLREANPNE